MIVKDLREILESLDDDADIVLSIGKGEVVVAELLTIRITRTPCKVHQRIVLSNNKPITKK